MNSEVSQEQQQQYMHYLQAQVDKFTAFMITQKNLNERHMQFQKTLNHILKKMEKNQQKITLIQIYQNDNLFQCKKMSKEKQNIKLLEKRFDSLQNQLKLIYKKLQIGQNKLYSQTEKQITPKSTQFDKNQSRNIQRGPLSQKQRNNAQLLQNQIYSQDQVIASNTEKSVQMNNSTLYELQKINQEEVYRYIEQIKQNMQIDIKKIEIETQKNKQSILKLSNHFNNLTSVNNMNLQKFKRESRALLPKVTSESTKQITSPQINQNSQSITKKQIKKMQRRLHSLFSQKVQEISNKFRKNSLKQQQHKNVHQPRISLKKYKFKTLQDNFQKEIKSCRNTQEQYQYGSTQKQINSKRKKSLFNNDILKDKNLNNSDKKQRQKKKKKHSQDKSLEPKQATSNKKKSKKQKDSSKQKQRQSHQKQLKRHLLKTQQGKSKQINDYMIY